MENNESRAWILLAKKMAGEASLPELRELDDLLKDLPIQPEEADLKKLWATPLENPEMPHPDMDKNWENLSQSLFPEKSHLYVTTVIDENATKPQRKRVWLYAAASLFILICTAAGLYYINLSGSILSVNKEADLPNQVSSRNGSKTSVVLPDGTKVWLNAGSNLYYKNDFTTKREVYLVGEAYFDVTHRTESPFIIHAANVNIRVLGTTFNVKAYAEDNLVETSLVKGSVELTTNDDPERKILLRPNEKITIRKTRRDADSIAGKTPVIKNNIKKEELYSISRMLVSTKDSLPEDIAWMKEKLIFRGEPFLQLSQRMERWYGVTIVFSDPYCSKIKFTGEFDNQNIVQAMEALAFSCNYKFKYSINKNQISIQRK